MFAIPFPPLDPVAVELGPIQIRWYALAYLAGFLLGWRYCLSLADRAPLRPDRQDIDEFLTWAVIGTILGGRIGFVIFYDVQGFLAEPLSALRIWEGGMAFHGGLIGVALALLLFSWRRGISPFALGDLVAAAAPIGLFFGRIANFVNNELWGRPTDLPWGVVFPIPPQWQPYLPIVPRHPSQLYEAFLEGIVLFVVCLVLIRRDGVRRRPGMVAGTFLAGYGVARFLVEFVRQYDPRFDLFLGVFTTGQLLSVPMIAIGLGLVLWARRRPLVGAAGAEATDRA